MLSQVRIRKKRHLISGNINQDIKTSKCVGYSYRLLSFHSHSSRTNKLASSPSYVLSRTGTLVIAQCFLLYRSARERYIFSSHPRGNSILFTKIQDRRQEEYLAYRTTWRAGRISISNNPVNRTRISNCIGVGIKSYISDEILGMERVLKNLRYCPTMEGKWIKMTHTHTHVHRKRQNTQMIIKWTAIYCNS